MIRKIPAYIIEIFDSYNEIVESFTIYARNWKEARNKADRKRTREGFMSIKKEDTMEVKQ